VSYLVYCVFRKPLAGEVEFPDGVAGHRVFTANYNGLSAALSKLGEPELPADISSLRAYEAVVESFYRRLTVIPLRYGCRVGCPYDAIILLKENYDDYDALLRQLEGLAEMGIKVLQDEPRAVAETDRLAIPSEWLPACARVSRAASAEAKKPNSPGASRATTVQNALANNLCDSLQGSFVRHKVEFPSCQRGHLLSLHFLVPRDSIEGFRQAAGHLPSKQPFKLFFSGPWPPYNFVDSLQP